MRAGGRAAPGVCTRATRGVRSTRRSALAPGRGRRRVAHAGVRQAPRGKLRGVHGDCGLQGKEGHLITFGHGARHLVETDVAQEVVASAIGTEIEESARQASHTGSFWGRVQVGVTIIEYRAYTLRSGDIHVGTYYPVS